MSKGKKTKDVNKRYMVNPDKWDEANKYGWIISMVEDNGNLLRGTDKDNPLMVKFVKDVLPKMFNDFYQVVIDQGVKAGIDEDTMIEMAEEYLATELGSALLWMGAQVDPEVLKEV